MSPPPRNAMPISDFHLGDPHRTIVEKVTIELGNLVQTKGAGFDDGNGGKETIRNGAGVHSPWPAIPSLPSCR